MNTIQAVMAVGGAGAMGAALVGAVAMAVAMLAERRSAGAVGVAAARFRLDQPGRANGVPLALPAPALAVSVSVRPAANDALDVAA